MKTITDSAGVQATPHPNKITLKGELARYRADEPTAAMDAVRRVVRAKAKAIIERRQAWPVELLDWRARRELAYWHDNGPANPWEDQINLTRPQRERALFHDRAWDAVFARFDKAADAAGRRAALASAFALDRGVTA